MKCPSLMACALGAAVFLVSPLASPGRLLAGELANVKVVTDASPDYSDMESMVHSITANWQTDEQKMYALFYWDHIGRRQTSPMWLHGYELTDPIMQYNDYGFTMCSTISGIKCSTWNYMGYPCRFFEIGLHTVPDVWYGGAFHHYDDSLSAIYTLCDGKTIASVQDIGKTLACEASGGKAEPGHIAMYHCLTGTSPNGFLQGADTERTLAHLGNMSFLPKNVRYQFQYYSQERGHRYILNLRDGEVYTRYYARQDADSPNAVVIDGKRAANYKADPGYYVPNQGETGEGPGRDPEFVNPRYHIRGNGVRLWTPGLGEEQYKESSSSLVNISASPWGLVPTAATPGEAVFKVEGGNVIASMHVLALVNLTSQESRASIAISTSNGLHWKEIWKSDQPPEKTLDLKLVDEVSGAYEVLVKVTLVPAKDHPESAQLRSISFQTITQVNGHTQPQLTLGKNTVYVGAGEQMQSIVLFPDLRHYKPLVVDEENIAHSSKRNQMLAQADPAKEAHITFKIDAPTDITSFTYGGRLSNRGEKNHIDFLHSFDGGKTWRQSYSCTDNNPPWDIIHFEKITDVPPGVRSVLFRYSLNGNASAEKLDVPGDEAHQPEACALYSVHMEVNHQLVAPAANTPVEVTFSWQERQADHTTIERSHTQLVEKLPATYTIDVGGDDLPIVDSLTVNLKGSRPDVKYGYSDGKDVGGEKFTGVWATYGKDLALHKPYTVSVPPEPKEKAWGGEDPGGTRLTDGRVGSSYTGGVNMSEGPIWAKGKNPEITVDLGAVQQCAAFRIHTMGYPWFDALKGDNTDQVEVLTSVDGKEFKSAGFFQFNLRRKDLPVNFMLPDDETLCGYNFFLSAGPTPVAARYVKYKVTPGRMMGITELQVLDGYKLEPFDWKIALPDPGQEGKPPPKADVSPNAKQWAAGERPLLGVPIPRGQ